MRIRRIYFFIAVAVVVLLFSVPPYSVIFYTTIIHPPTSYLEQFSHLDLQERRLFRYGNSYSFFIRVKRALEQGHIQNPVILLPPQEYLDSAGVAGVYMVEPSEYYYYTGNRAVWANSPDAEQARWTFVPRQTEITLKQIESKEELDKLLKLYRPYLQHK